MFGEVALLDLRELDLDIVMYSLLDEPFALLLFDFNEYVGDAALEDLRESKDGIEYEGEVGLPLSQNSPGSTKLSGEAARLEHKE